jgi:hypothetical protein
MLAFPSARVTWLCSLDPRRHLHDLCRVVASVSDGTKEEERRGSNKLNLFIALPPWCYYYRALTPVS